MHQALSNKVVQVCSRLLHVPLLFPPHTSAHTWNNRLCWSALSGRAKSHTSAAPAGRSTLPGPPGSCPAVADPSGPPPPTLPAAPRSRAAKSLYSPSVSRDLTRSATPGGAAPAGAAAAKLPRPPTAAVRANDGGDASSAAAASSAQRSTRDARAAGRDAS
eukprot:352594-Chlamydomonas_euryale.AAC.4